MQSCNFEVFILNRIFVQTYFRDTTNLEPLPPIPIIQQDVVTGQGGSRDFEKGALYVSHRGWLAKKILSFRLSKKV